MTEEQEWAWAAGIFEGEGSLHWSKPNNRYTSLQIAMCDRDVLERFAAVVGAGNVLGPYEQAPGSKWKLRYTWQCGRWPEVVRIAQKLYPMFGERRQRQFDELLSQRAPRQYQHKENDLALAG